MMNLCIRCICFDVKYCSLHCITGTKFAADCDFCYRSSTGISLVSAGFCHSLFSINSLPCKKVYHAFYSNLLNRLIV